MSCRCRSGSSSAYRWSQASPRGWSSDSKLASRKFRPRTWAAAAFSAPIAATGLWWLTSEPFGDGVPLGPLYCTVAFPAGAQFNWRLEHGVRRAVEHRQRGGGPRVALTLQRVGLHHDRVWLGIATLVFFSPLAFRSLRDFLSEQMAIESAHATGIIGGAGSLLATVIA